MNCESCANYKPIEVKPFDWETFKADKIAVHCKTLEQAKAFLQECFDHGVKFYSGYKNHISLSLFGDFSKGCSYTAGHFTPEFLEYNQGTEYHIKKGYTIVKYPFQPIEPKREPITLYCIKDHKPGTWLSKGKTYCLSADGKIQFDDGFVAIGYESFADYMKCNPSRKDHLVECVKRPAKVGEWVLLNNTHHSIALTVGNVYQIKKHYHTDTYGVEGVLKPIPDAVDDGLWCINTSEFLVLDGYHPEPETKYWSGKVVCVDDAGTDVTKGKVYTVKDGLMADDVGDLRPTNWEIQGRIESVGNLNSRLTSQFIEFKGMANG